MAAVAFLLAFGVFAALSLLTHTPHDLRDEPINTEVQNFCGLGGAYVSQALYDVFGWLAVCIPVLSVLWGFDLIRWGRHRRSYIRFAGGVLFIASGASIASLWSASGGAGGIVGVLLNKYVLTRLLPPLAARLTAVFLFFVALLLLTEMKLLDWIKLLIAAIRRHLHIRVRQIEQEVEGPSPEQAYAHPPYVAQDRPPVYEQPIPDRIPAQTATAPPPITAPPIAVEQRPEPLLDAEAQQIARLELPVYPQPMPAAGARREKLPAYRFPPVDLLDRHVPIDRSRQEHLIKEKVAILENTLMQFNIEARVMEIQRGPVITQYELALAPGIKVQRIISLSDDIAMAVKAPSVRIVAPIPGKSTVGVEVPNVNRDIVRLRDLIETYQSTHRSLVIPLMLGRDAAGVPLFSDLAQMPHLLIAGATGSGKSVCINSIILNIMMTKTPEDVKLLLVDPKMVELACFKDIPHLMSPVVTDMKRAALVLEWACLKMDERYALFSRTSVRNISGFNQLGEREITRRLTEGDAEARLDDVPFYLPHVVIVVDELADLMMLASKEVECSITRLSQKSRAVGIHLILATQRPSVDVITGLIKANLPSRISFKVSSKIDSGVILDQRGAEKLLGMGDMLFLPPGTSRLIRAQGTFVSDSEIARVTDFAHAQREPAYDLELAQYRMVSQKSSEERDLLYPEAVRIVLETERGSVSLLQRRLEVGYSRAARLIDMMADDGIVGEYKGSQARDILMTLQEWEDIQKAAAPKDTE